MNTELTAGRAKALAGMNLSGLKYTECLDEVAKVFGMKDQTTMMSMLKEPISAPSARENLSFPDPYRHVPHEARNPQAKRFFEPERHDGYPEYIAALMFWTLFKSRQVENIASYGEYLGRKDITKNFDDWWSEEAIKICSADIEVCSAIMNAASDLAVNSKPFPWILTVPRYADLRYNVDKLISMDFEQAIIQADGVIEQTIRKGSNNQYRNLDLKARDAYNLLEKSITDAFLKMKDEMRIVFEK